MRAAAIALFVSVLMPVSAGAQLLTPQKISSEAGDSRGMIETGERIDFDRGTFDLANAGDVDGDGIDDVALSSEGSLWILFMNPDGTVRTYRKATSTRSIPVITVAPLGDIDDDDVPDLVVRAVDAQSASVWVLFLNRDGTVKRMHKVCDIGPETTCSGVDGDRPLDINGDGASDYVDGNPNGIVINFLNKDGDRVSHQVICNYVRANGDSCHEGGFTGEGDIGRAAVTIGDLDGDGVPELAIGGGWHDDGCEGPFQQTCRRGAVWILFVNKSGTVKHHAKISQTDGGFTGVLIDDAQFGRSLTALDDMDGDGVRELAVGAPGVSGASTGDVWILSIRYDPANRDILVKWHQRIGENEGGFTGPLRQGDRFGAQLTRLGDIDDDPETVETLVVASTLDEFRGENRGALWFLFIRGNGTVKRHLKLRSSDFLFLPDDGDHFGTAVTSLGDLNGDGIEDMAVGAPDHKNGGAVWILFLTADGKIKRHQLIDAEWGDFDGPLAEGDRFGSALARLADAGGDGVMLAVGAPGDDELGAVWILRLSPSGRVIRSQKIGVTGGRGDAFGSSLAAPGDINGDGVHDLVVGAPFDDERGPDRGAVWMLHLDEDGSVRDRIKLTDPESVRLGHALADLGARDDGRRLAVAARDALRMLDIEDGVVTGLRPLVSSDAVPAEGVQSLAAVADLDGDGFSELAVGLQTGSGETIAMMFLGADGSTRFTRTLESFAGTSGSGFGRSVATVGDVDDDGVVDLVIGAPLDADGGPERGAVWLTSLRTLLGPVITETVVDPERPVSGQDISISAKIVDIGSIESASVHVRRGGGVNFFSYALVERTPGVYGASLYGISNGERGLEYKISTTNNLGITTTAPVDGTFSVRVYVPDGLRHPLHSASYRLVSVPLDLDDKRARHLLEDDLGPYDKKRWRFFNHRRIVELDEFDIIVEPGSAFWLVVRDSGHELTTGPGTSIRTDEEFGIRLDPGWNYISSPFSFSVPVTRLRLKSGAAVPMLRSYDGAWNRPEEAPVERLAPYTGYAVFSASSEEDSLFIDPDLSSLPGDNAAHEVVSPPDWFVRIRARAGLSHEAVGIAGVARGASTGWDRFDRPDPPFVGDNIRLSFPHAEWNSRASDYGTDVRSTPTSEEQWTFVVESHEAGRVELRFEEIDSVPAEFDVFLVDEITGVRQDLRTDPRYELALHGESDVRQLSLKVGGALSGQDAPARFALLRAFPNPFQEAVTIPYTLPETSPVTLDIFDILGRRVARVLDGEMEAGYHAAVWNGRSDSGVAMGSGMYFARLRMGGLTETNSIVRVR